MTGTINIRALTLKNLDRTRMKNEEATAIFAA